MKYTALALVVSALALPATLHAQDEHIETDRPGETQAAKTVDAGSLQAELGFRREVESQDEVRYHEPRTVLRYGATKWLELRAEIDPVTAHDRYGGGNAIGLLPVAPGLKAKICEGKGARPAIAFFTQVGIPKLSSKEFRPTYAEPRARFLFGNKLTEKLRLSYNVGAEWNGDDTNPQWLYTIAPELELGKHWEAFVEAYGFLQSGSLPENSFDAGIAYYAGKNIKLDLSAGVGLTSAAPVNFVALGFSIRTGK